MDAKTYAGQFDRTLAPTFFAENVNPIFLGLLLAGRKQTADIVDAAKRGLFYGNTKKLEEKGLAKEAFNDLDLPYQDAADLIHAVLGIEGEVGEISEAALDDRLSDEERRARVVDESGDTLWYLHLLFKQFDPPISLDEVLDRNIAKLAKRYPDKFTTDAAVNRDLEGEAKVFDVTTRKIAAGTVTCAKPAIATVTREQLHANALAPGAISPNALH
jgi:NTP pyrophosphatase (non-canonical NTP hydrolase)